MEDHMNNPGPSPTGCEEPWKCFKQESDVVGHVFCTEIMVIRCQLNSMHTGTEWDGKPVVYISKTKAIELESTF